MTTEEIMNLADEYAQECKDFGYLDHSEPRAVLLAAVEELAKDAERYRWLRLQEGLKLEMIAEGTDTVIEFDAAVDAAMKGQS